MLKKIAFVFIGLGIISFLLINHTLGEIQAQMVDNHELGTVSLLVGETLARLASHPSVEAATVLRNQLVGVFTLIAAILLILAYSGQHLNRTVPLNREMAMRPAWSTYAVVLWIAIGIPLAAGVWWFIYNVETFAGPLRSFVLHLFQ